MIDEPKNKPSESDDKMNWTTADGLTIDDSDAEGEPFDFSPIDDDTTD